ncbi:cytidine deaminase [Azospirillum sp. TSO35-2]|uniref:cytidine deaminase n=1 Tax=Azospirillum sp. TSO35-2 TaxID=716796 RepID=UPI000D61B50D|nr:cytidine deaminase [Azospirillum sp. TSO35-2]PWC37421.1 cytidine deaminase [Azospirillum sp. TSO35-2]
MADTPDLSLLIEAARAARENAHAPYSKFKVGAAILGESGRIFAGCNVENAAYPQGQCAETSAIGAMVTAGDRRIRMIVVMGGEPGAAELCTPCGGCRQRIREFAAPDTPIHVCDPAGLRRSFTLDALLPQSFGPTNLAF